MLPPHSKSSGKVGDVNILAVSVGSSSIKLRVIDDDDTTLATEGHRDLGPGVSQVACFDTSFPTDMPARAATYAVPREWREECGIRRFGFHGLSHDWASRRAAELLGRSRGELALVTAHIGAGASLAAVEGGHSVDTTMGFTPLEGIVMAFRSGSIDPGLVLWVQQCKGLSADGVGQILERKSGLLGLSDDSGDLRKVISAADAGDHEAHLAYEVHAYRIRTDVAAMVAAMGGIEGPVFAGEAGEASARLRADTCAGLGLPGAEIAASTNRGLSGDGVISAVAVRPAVLVVEAREDLEIARQVRQLLDLRPCCGMSGGARRSAGRQLLQVPEGEESVSDAPVRAEGVSPAVAVPT